MFEVRRVRLLLLLPATAALSLFGARSAAACSCAGTPTVLDEFERSEVVVLARAVSVEKSERAAPEGRMSDGENFVNGVASTTMRVERVYKGRVRVGDELTFAQGGGADCVWTFSEKSVGQQFLLYLKTPGKGFKLWVAGVCGRSNAAEYAGDDLLYLNKLDKVRGKTRLSGSVSFRGDEGSMSVAGRVLRVAGGGKTYELKTDRRGVYEIYDLPPGRYTVEPEVPAGWKVNDSVLDYSPSVERGERADDDARAGRVTRIPVVVRAGRHASLDIEFEVDNAIRGRVFDPGGRPLKDVCVSAVRPDPSEKGGYHADCTDASGEFAVEELPPGNYILVVNSTGMVTANEPFKTFYYPNVTERERAGVIRVGAGDDLKGFDIYAPRVEATVTVEGVLLYSDGRPVEGEFVQFKAGKAPEGFDGDAHATTDARGRFSMKILKGLGGELYGGMYAVAGEFENCTKLEAIIRESGRGGTEVRTPAVKIQADADLFDLELKYPFPWCKKSKR